MLLKEYSIAMLRFHLDANELRMLCMQKHDPTKGKNDLTCV